jgi:hypothetical protein
MYETIAVGTSEFSDKKIEGVTYSRYEKGSVAIYSDTSANEWPC